MDGYREHFSFSGNADTRALAKSLNFKTTSLNAEERANVERALGEIACTPEGAFLIERAAARSKDGKINIVATPDGDTLSGRPNDIVIGRKDSGLSYQSPRTGQFHDASLQRMLVHELHHMSMGHQNASLTDEADVIRMTNQFMRKYYGEPERNESVLRFNTGGSPGWDVNPNFDSKGFSPESVRTDLLDMSAEEIANASPETQSLYEFRNSRELFEEQYNQLKESVGADYVDFDINAHIQSKSNLDGPDADPKPVPIPARQPLTPSI